MCYYIERNMGCFMDKVTLRENLFDKYFQIDDGIILKDLLGKLSYIPDTYNKLRFLCERNIKHFDLFSSLNNFKMVCYNQKKFLVLEIRMWKYIIIDIDEMKCINQNEFDSSFDLSFFANNFDNCDDELFSLIYRIEQYSGDINELVSFYFKNVDVFNLTSQIYFKLSENDAWTWVHVDFINENVQMGFQTPDQLLYEQLFFKYDLTPSGMQDAIQKIGIDKVQEIFSKMNYIKIPRHFIPNDLYQQYLNYSNYEIKLTKNLL